MDETTRLREELEKVRRQRDLPDEEFAELHAATMAVAQHPRLRLRMQADGVHVTGGDIEAAARGDERAQRDIDVGRMLIEWIMRVGGGEDAVATVRTTAVCVPCSSEEAA